MMQSRLFCHSDQYSPVLFHRTTLLHKIAGLPGRLIQSGCFAHRLARFGGPISAQCGGPDKSAGP